LPHTLGMVGALALELHILVLPDGSVGDAEVIKSTGEPEIDRLAIGTVTNSWSYLAASIGGRPIEAWTIVIVRFAAIQCTDTYIWCRPSAPCESQRQWSCFDRGERVMALPCKIPGLALDESQ